MDCRACSVTFKPQLVVGTGGYASAPACRSRSCTGVPVAVQEQNSFPGLTTRMMSRWARQVHLGFPEAQRHLKPGQAHGSVLHSAIRSGRRIPHSTAPRAARRFGLRTDATVLLVVGGSQGSRAINEALLAAVAGVDRGSWIAGERVARARDRSSGQLGRITTNRCDHG